MAGDEKPFLTLRKPTNEPTPVGRSRPIERPKLPTPARQGARMGGKIASLSDQFEAASLAISQQAPLTSQEQVLVIETIGEVQNFYKAASRIPELELLLEDLTLEEQDEDFKFSNAKKLLDKKLYLLSTKIESLHSIVGMWNSYQADPEADFPRNFGPWKNLFKQLKEVRFWDVQDRIEEDIRDYWSTKLLEPGERVKFEIELWFKANIERSIEVERECRALVEALNGTIFSVTRFPEIRYHALLVDLPNEVISAILAGGTPLLMTNPAVMFFKPNAQGMSVGTDRETFNEIIGDRPVGNDNPLVGVLDGLPAVNHPLLADRVVIDDPNDYAASYDAVNARVHGTAMVSLILHGDLTENLPTLQSKIYVHPILQAKQGAFESSPDDQLLLDIVHRAIRRMFEGEGEMPPTAPTVRIINLSVGDRVRYFYGRMSPWARLLDWLSFKYGILFFVSAGNVEQSVRFAMTAGQLREISEEEFSHLAVGWLVEGATSRRLLSPAESINALTIGASYKDSATPPRIDGRRLLFSRLAPSPYSRSGLGYRNSVKPDLLLPGGRVLYLDPMLNDAPAELKPLSRIVGAPPGLKCASANNQFSYEKGTSGATALASRQAALILTKINDLREAMPEIQERGVDAALVKALLVHCGSWGDMKSFIGDAIKKIEPDIYWMKLRKAISSLVGFGSVDAERANGCEDHRATLLRGDLITPGYTHEYSIPLPPTINGKREWRKLCITLAWLSPTECSRQAYRGAKLGFQPPDETLRVKRMESESNIVRRGTVQHEILEGEEALAFEDGDLLTIKVVCDLDAADNIEPIPYGLAVSLEVEQGVGVLLYQEIRDRINVPIAVRAKV